jgi:hypothetical protein
MGTLGNSDFKADLRSPTRLRNTPRIHSTPDLICLQYPVPIVIHPFIFNPGGSPKGEVFVSLLDLKLPTVGSVKSSTNSHAVRLYPPGRSPRSIQPFPPLNYLLWYCANLSSVFSHILLTTLNKSTSTPNNNHIQQN